MGIKEKGKHTYTEILQQPREWRSTLEWAIQNREYIRDLFGEKERPVAFVGCGTSHYLGICASAIFAKIGGRMSRPVPGAEAFLFPDLYGIGGAGKAAKDTIMVFISRSGETTETILAQRYFKENIGGKTAALTCREESTLAKEADYLLPAQGVDEKSVVMTGSFTSMLLLIAASAGIISRNNGYIDELGLLPDECARLISEYEEPVKGIIRENAIERFIFLGSGPFYGAANEGMLKMKEMTLSWSEAYHSLEFRHGPKSVINDNTLISYLISDSGFEYERVMPEEFKAYGALNLIFRTAGMAEKMELSSVGTDLVCTLGDGLSEYSRLIAIVPVLQLLAYYQALQKDIDPDSPKNLTQVVKLL